MEMNTKDVHTKLALALLSFWIFVANAIVTGQYSSYLPESSYSSHSSSSSSSFSPSSSSSYGSENRNYYDYPSEPNDAAQEYSKDSYQHQQFQYGGGDFDDEDSYNQPHHHHQTQTNYQPDYLSEHIFPFRQNQVRDSYGRPYSSHQSADLGPDLSSSSLVSYDNIGFNRSELMEYHAAAAAADEVKYPPLNLESQQHHQQQQQQQPLTKQQHLRAAHYTPTNNYLSSPSASGRLNSLSPYLADDDEKVSATFKDNTAYSNTEALMMMLNMSIPPSPPPPVKPLYQSNAHGQRNVRTYLLGEEPHQHQHQLDPIQHSIPKDNKVETHFDSPFNNNASLLSQTFFVGDDSDLSSSNSYHHPDQLQLDTHTLSLLQKYLAQHQHVVSSAQSVPAPFQLGNTIPISKHVEITKHVPVPVYRQIHVPYRKTVRIEIPRPVISTYPRPYPIKIPTVTKTVAVPMVREVKIPIEKVMPYPVENRVPYILQKRVPFEVEKQIAVPKYYPFPVKVPIVRTILHKKKQPHLLQHHPSLLEYYPRHHK